MLKNYFKIALRNIVNHRIYSFINIIGLSTGIAFTLLIGAYIWSELNVNKEVPNENRIFLLESRNKDGGADYTSYVPNPLSKTLNDEYPNLVTNYYRWLWKNVPVSNGDKHFRDNIQLGDTTFMSMFGFKLLYGNIHTVFKETNAVVITKEKALQYFNTANAVGNILTIENTNGDKLSFIVTGVLENLPSNSITTTQAADKSGTNNSIFLPISALKNWQQNDELLDWNTAKISYVQLHKGISPNDLIKPLQQLLKLHTSPEVQRSMLLRFVPLSDTYLDANNCTAKKMIYTLSLTALFILLMAVVNFINISIGNSSSRLKEIGLRKVFGSEKKQLVLQFLIESFIIVFIAACFSLIIYLLLQPFFSSFIGKSIPSLFSFPLYFIGILILFVIVIGLMSGFYPALILSSIQIADSVKGKLKAANENILLRKVFMGFQFLIALVVFISAIIISKQVSYDINTDLGFDKEQLLNVWLPRKWTIDGVRKIETVRDELTALPGVVSASVNYTVPGWNASDVPEFYKQGDNDENTIGTFGIITDARYAETFKIPLLAGKFFSGSDVVSDSSSIVINQTLLKDLGWHNAYEAIGKSIINSNDNKSYTISGVVKDFHVESKQVTIQPLAFLNIFQTNSYRYLSIRIRPGNTQQTIEALQKKWSVLEPDEAFKFSFMDETMEMIYKSDIQLKNASYLATILAIIIVLLGTVSIISLNIAKRTKEIGIRKVLGASVINILSLFVKDVLILITFAALIAFPAAYLIMKFWLNNYAYRININGYPFIIVFLFMTLVVTLLIIFQTVKAAIANPVKSLKTE